MAENRSVCRSEGVRSRMRRTSGRNPMSAIRSASSITTLRTEPSVSAFRSSRSWSRPGHATSTSTPFLSCSICRLILVPPYAARTHSCWARASGRSSSAICSASSRVGANTRADGALGAELAVRTMRGMPKAMVFPEPVGARPHMSRPANPSGIVAS